MVATATRPTYAPSRSTASPTRCVSQVVISAEHGARHAPPSQRSAAFADPMSRTAASGRNFARPSDHTDRHRVHSTRSAMTCPVVVRSLVTDEMSGQPTSARFSTVAPVVPFDAWSWEPTESETESPTNMTRGVVPAKGGKTPVGAAEVAAAAGAAAFATRASGILST